MTENWFSEILYPDFRQVLQINKVIYEDRSNYQEIRIFETSRFGRVLTLDGIVQTTEQDEFCYHEMLVHVPLIAHGTPKSMAIIGGGDGGALEEALKHPLEAVTLVELDDVVVTLARNYLPSICGQAFDDARTNLVFMNGTEFVKQTDEKFDVIVVDSTDPIGPGKVLFTPEFYADCRNCLTEDGILVCQSGVTFMQDDEARDTYGHLNKLFVDADFYITQVPTYGAGFMTFGWGANTPRARATPVEELEQRFKALGLRLGYYSPVVHRAAFALPGYIEALKG